MSTTILNYFVTNSSPPQADGVFLAVFYNKPDIKKFIEMLPEKVTLNYIDYRDNLDGHIRLFQECLDAGNTDPLYGMLHECDYYIVQYDPVDAIIKEFVDSYCELHEVEREEVEEMVEEKDEEIREILYDRNREEPGILEQLLKNTSDIELRITRYSNYECIGSWWLISSGHIEYNGYMKQLIDALNLNPAIVKKEFIEREVNIAGRFPDKKDRDGEEYVSYDDFIAELMNMTSGVNQLVVLAKIDARDIVTLAEAKYVTIPRGNTCGMFDTCNGGGSMLVMTLLRDMVIKIGKIPRQSRYDAWSIEVENFAGSAGCYTIRDVYGRGGMFGDRIQVKEDQKISND